MDTSLRSAIRPAVRDAYRTDSGLARLVLARYGTDAHVWIPGIGYFNGLQAGNYIDSAGTTAGLVDNPVGLAMDAENTALGAELVTNGAFDSATGWTVGTGWTISGGVASATGPTGDGLYTSQAAYTTGKVYLVSFDKTGTQNISVYVRAGGPFTTTLSGRVFMYITAGASATRGVEFYFAGTGGTIDNISVREVTGAITATQGTTANKPILRRGAVNLLLRSEEFNSAPWSVSNASISQDSATSPTGTQTADKLIENTATSQHVVRQNYTISASTQYCFSVYVKAAERTRCIIKISSSSSTFEVLFASVNLTTGVVTWGQANGGSSATGVVTNAGDGWYRVSVTGLIGTKTDLGVSVGLVNDSIQENYLGDGTSGIYVWGAQLELGSTASQYIPTTTAAASSSSGNYYWQFDGSNDSLALSSVPFQMADDHCVVAGVRQGTNVSAAWSINSSTDAVPYVARIRRGTANTLTIDWRSDAAVNIAHSVALTDNSIGVVSARNIAGTKIGRLNGVQFGTSSTAQGTTTVNGATIGAYISATTTYWNGSIYPVIAIKGTVSDADLLILERWVGQMSGVSI